MHNGNNIFKTLCDKPDAFCVLGTGYLVVYRKGQSRALSLFFSLYIAYQAVDPENIRLLADDTALFMSHSDLHTLVETVRFRAHDLCKWRKYKLIINTEKIILFYFVQ